MTSSIDFQNFLKSLQLFRDDCFHQTIPAWEKVSLDQFNDIKWQNAYLIKKNII